MMDGRIITNDDKKAKYYRWIAYARRFAKFIPQIIQLILAIAIIPLMISLTPYIDGSAEMETPLTTSQITALFLILIVFYTIHLAGKMGRS